MVLSAHVLLHVGHCHCEVCVWSPCEVVLRVCVVLSAVHLHVRV